MSAVLIKTVPPLLDDSTNLGINARVNIIADAQEAGQELRHVAVERKNGLTWTSLRGMTAARVGVRGGVLSHTEGIQTSRHRLRLPG
jgi:hypothetical protein